VLAPRAQAADAHACSRCTQYLYLSGGGRNACMSSEARSAAHRGHVELRAWWEGVDVSSALAHLDVKPKVRELDVKAASQVAVANAYARVWVRLCL
jgi:hypothetical protein